MLKVESLVEKRATRELSVLMFVVISFLTTDMISSFTNKDMTYMKKRGNKNLTVSKWTFLKKSWKSFFFSHHIKCLKKVNFSCHF